MKKGKILTKLIIGLSSLVMFSGCANLYNSFEDDEEFLKMIEKHSYAEYRKPVRHRVALPDIWNNIQLKSKVPTNVMGYNGQGKRKVFSYDGMALIWDSDFLKILNEAKKYTPMPEGTNSFGVKFDHWQTYSETTNGPVRDCEDLAFLLEELGSRKNFEIDCVYGFYSKFSYLNGASHLWNEVSAGGETWVFDMSLSKIFKKTRNSRTHIPLKPQRSILAKLEDYKIKTKKPYLKFNKNYPDAPSLSDFIAQQSKKYNLHLAAATNKTSVIVRPLKSQRGR